MSLAEKVQAVENQHHIKLEVNGDTVTYPGVKGPDDKGPGTRTFSRADLDEGVFESWFELAHAEATDTKVKATPSSSSRTFTGTSTTATTAPQQPTKTPEQIKTQAEQVKATERDKAR